TAFLLNYPGRRRCLDAPGEGRVAGRHQDPTVRHAQDLATGTAHRAFIRTGRYNTGVFGHHPFSYQASSPFTNLEVSDEGLTKLEPFLGAAHEVSGTDGFRLLRARLLNRVFRI